MRNILVLVSMMLCSATPGVAQVSVGIGIAVPGVSIGIDLPAYPRLVRVPDYPVYYAPGLTANFFFYDGLYWVFQGDNWYASSWYNGPWWVVGREAVPLYVLRVPVRYYRQPPPYFVGWRPDAPPRWNEHWGRDWEQQRRGWDTWDRRHAPPPAPLPSYQRRYSGDRYPQQFERQQEIHDQRYRYRPHDEVARQYYQQQRQQRPPPPPRQGADDRRPAQPQQGAAQRPPPQPQPQGTAPQGRPPPTDRGREQAPQGGGAARHQERGQGQEADRGKGDGRGQERRQ